MTNVVTVEYYDPDTVKSVYIAAKEYGFNVIDIIEGPDTSTATITIKGESEILNRFIEDNEEGEVMPFCQSPVRDMSDLEYLNWLQTSLKNEGYDINLVIPDDMDDTDDNFNVDNINQKIKIKENNNV